MPFLDASARSIDIGPNYAIQAPYLLGEIKQIRIGSLGDRTLPGELEDRWEALLANAEITTESAFSLAAADQRPLAPGRQFRQDPAAPVTREGEDALVFVAKYTLPNTEYAILYRDEGGIYRWIFPSRQVGGTPVRSGGALRFYLPRTGAPKPPTNGADKRGDWTAGGRRIIRLLRWTLRDAIGKSVRWIAEQWETKHRPYQLQHVEQGKIGGPVQWDSIRSGRALLLIHGTFSTAGAAFDGLVNHPLFDQLASTYQNRIFAFDHPSMHQSPQENIQWLLDNLPDTSALQLDIVSHSRGGLVARTISEWLNELNPNGRAITVDKTIFVGTPHQGTVLADGENWYDFVDRYTNLITELPDNTYTIIAEAILTVVKLLAFGGLHGLPGIQVMLPNGDYLQKMNSTTVHGSTYYAISADFSPKDANLFARLRKQTQDFFVDRIFENQANDGVVPTEGCYQVLTQSHGFPIPPERYRNFGSEAQVHHMNYFRNEAVTQQIVEWLA